MTVNRKQESNPRAVLINPLKLYIDLVGDQWLRDIHLTAQSSSCWTRLLLVCNFGSRSPVTAAAIPAFPAPHPSIPPAPCTTTAQRSAVLRPPGSCFLPSTPQHYQTTSGAGKRQLQMHMKQSLSGK